MRSLGLILALLSAFGVANLRPWLLSHCDDATVAMCADPCCPVEPAPAAPARDACTFCAAVVVVPDDLMPSDVVAMPPVQPSRLLFRFSSHAAATGAQPVPAPPSGGIPRHVVLLI